MDMGINLFLPRVTHEPLKRCALTDPCNNPLSPYAQQCQCFPLPLSLDSLLPCRMSSLRRDGLPKTMTRWVRYFFGAMP